MPASPRDAGRSGAALREAWRGEDAPARSALPPAAAEAGPDGWVALTVPVLDRGAAAVRPHKGRRHHAPGSARTGPCPADSPRSLPAPPPPFLQPRLCSRGSPAFGASDWVGRTPGAATGGRWNLRRGHERMQRGAPVFLSLQSRCGPHAAGLFTPGLGAGRCRRAPGEKGREAGGVRTLRACTCWSWPLPAPHTTRAAVYY